MTLDSPPIASSMRRGRNGMPMTAEDIKLKAWTWSFSRFKKYLECPEHYRLHYLEDLKIPPLSQRPFFQGSVAHKLVEDTFAKWKAQEIPTMAEGLHDLETVFRSYAQKIDWKDEGELQRAYLEAQSLFHHYVTLLDSQGLVDPSVRCEFKFGTYEKPLILPSGLRLVGSIDWLKLNETTRTAEIWDAKTSQGANFLDPRQLDLYGLAVRTLFDYEIEKAGYLMIRWERPRRHTISVLGMSAVESALVEVSRQVERGVFDTTPAMSMCAKCQYQTQCGKFSNWIMTSQDSEVTW